MSKSTEPLSSTVVHNRIIGNRSNFRGRQQGNPMYRDEEDSRYNYRSILYTRVYLRVQRVRRNVYI